MYMFNFCRNNTKQHYFLLGVRKAIYNIVYNTGRNTGRVSVEPGILHQATFEEAKEAIEGLGKGD